MAVGKVKWFDSKKGFGFILNPQGKDIFVHFTEIQCDGFRMLEEEQLVEYELQEGPKGLLARGVKVLSGAKVKV